MKGRQKSDENAPEKVNCRDDASDNETDDQ